MASTNPVEWPAPEFPGAGQRLLLILALGLALAVVAIRLVIDARLAVVALLELAGRYTPCARDIGLAVPVPRHDVAQVAFAA